MMVSNATERIPSEICSQAYSVQAEIIYSVFEKVGQLIPRWGKTEFVNADFFHWYAILFLNFILFI